jgi:hypothetical protein
MVSRSANTKQAGRSSYKATTLKYFVVSGKYGNSSAVITLLSS